MVRKCFCEPSAQWMAAFAASTPPPFLSFSAVAAGMYLCRSESPARKIAPGLSNACNNLRVSIGETPGVMVSESQ